MRKSGRVGSVLIVASFLLFAFACVGYAATDYPTKPINYIIGYTPGSSADITIRPLAEAAGKILGQPIIILNKPGAATSLSLTQIKNEKPDGYTIGSIVGSSILNPYLEKVPYDVNKDFTPIVKFVDNIMGLTVRSDSPWKTLPEFLAFAKANPGRIKYSHFGTVNHMAMAGLAQEAGIKWVNIAYAGSKEAVVAILGKHVDAYPGGVDWAPYVESGELRLLASLGPKRYKMYPNVPTFVDFGYKTWMASPHGIIGPKGLPAPIVEKLHNAFKEAMNDPGFLIVAKTITLEVFYANQEGLAKEIKDLDEVFGRFTKELNIK